MDHAAAMQLFREVHATFAREKTDEGDEEEADEMAPSSGEIAQGYREQLATQLSALPAAGFERFCQRLLRESGFELVDGEKLLEMCETLELGLKPKQTFELDEQFFMEFMA